MESPSPAGHDFLRRLGVGAYQGNAIVHWTMTVADRKQGWLDQSAHALWREVLLHTLARYRLAAPVYCLMPDHAHLLMVRLGARSDQRRALCFLRRYTAGMFAPAGGTGWQKQAYDHVLRNTGRERGAFQTMAHYIVQNPVRAGLSSAAEEWSFSGSLEPGWPEMDWRMPDYWARWWRIYLQAVGP